MGCYVLFTIWLRSGSRRGWAPRPGRWFWEEAIQYWQSEFFSIGVLLVLSIRLRERGSPESKPVHAAHAATGS